MAATAQQPRPLTAQQMNVVSFIARFNAENGGLSPTFEEISAALGFSKITASEHVHQAQRKGWLTMEKHKARSIRLLVGTCTCCGQKLPVQIGEMAAVAR